MKSIVFKLRMVGYILDGVVPQLTPPYLYFAAP